MKIQFHTVSRPLQVLAGVIVVTSGLAIARAQETPLPPPSPIALTAEENALRAEKNLQTAVTFEASRQPLPEVLAALQKQSGIALRIAPDSPLATKLLTARAKDLSLISVMENLSQLYGAMWSKQGAAFELKNKQNLLDSVAWKLDSTAYNAALNAIDHPIDWRDEIANIGVPQLQQKNGVSFEEVSPEIAQQLREQLEPQDVAKLGLAMNAARLPNLGNSKVEITNESTPDTAVLMLTFLTAEGARAGQKFVTVQPNTPQPNAK